MVAVLMLWVLSGCGGTPPCPGFPGDFPIDRGIAAEGSDWDALDALVVSELEAACVPALSVALVDEDGVIFESAYGWADLEAERPALTTTPFMLASASKMVDGLALVLAEADGHLALSDPAADHLPFALKNPRLGADQPPIRLTHLATHSSGIQDNWDILDDTYVDGDSPIVLADFVAGYLSPGGGWYDPTRNFFRWEPADAWYYSNVGAALAATAVQEAVGEPFEDWTRRRLLDPLGMVDTGWFLRDFADPDLIARPYSFTAAGQWAPQEHYGFPTWPDGQLRSTAGEVGRLLSLALAGGRWQGEQVVPAAAIEALLAEPYPSLSRWYLRGWLTRQRIFWFDMDLGGRHLVGHDGDDIGVSTEVFYDAEARVGVAVLMSLADGERDGRPREATAAIQEALYTIGEQR